MSETKDRPALDLSQGVPASTLADGQMILGRVGDADVVLARVGQELFAVRAQCSHYRGPLVEGLIVGDTVRCPWHHACFSLRTGEAVRAPALDPIPRWRVETKGDQIFVREKLPPAAAPASQAPAPSSIVIVGGGAAGVAAAEMLRREGYSGAVTMISADDSLANIDLNSRVVALPPGQFDNCRNVIGVAAGEFKAGPVAAALAGRYLTSLVVDEAVAKHIMGHIGAAEHGK